MRLRIAAITALCALAAAAIASAGVDTPTRHSHALAAAPPPAGTRWYVDPHSAAAKQEAAWRSSDPAAAAEIAKIASQPTAAWFGGSDAGDVFTAVQRRVAAASAAGAEALLVAYDIPGRDCGGFSSGGAKTDSGYDSWIGAFAAGIGSHRATVILEPDALAGMNCLSGDDQAARLSMLNHAVSVLASRPRVRVYIDAGHAGWRSASDMAERLRDAGIARATGFALNVAGYDATAREVAYGESIAARVGGKHFVIDTSRNGNGSNGEWCNAPGRALGTSPTVNTGNPLVDAFLWIKTPGVSDGTCNGGPPAGTWWPSYALDLAKAAPAPRSHQR